MIKCPNKNSPEYKALEKMTGSQAMFLFLKNNDIFDNPIFEYLLENTSMEYAVSKIAFIVSEGFSTDTFSVEGSNIILHKPKEVHEVEDIDTSINQRYDIEKGHPLYNVYYSMHLGFLDREGILVKNKKGEVLHSGAPRYSTSIAAAEKSYLKLDELEERLAKAETYTLNKDDGNYYKDDGTTPHNLIRVSDVKNRILGKTFNNKNDEPSSRGSIIDEMVRTMVNNRNTTVEDLINLYNSDELEKERTAAFEFTENFIKELHTALNEFIDKHPDYNIRADIPSMAYQRGNETVVGTIDLLFYKDDDAFIVDVKTSKRYLSEDYATDGRFDSYEPGHRIQQQLYMEILEANLGIELSAPRILHIKTNPNPQQTGYTNAEIDEFHTLDISESLPEPIINEILELKTSNGNTNTVEVNLSEGEVRYVSSGNFVSKKLHHRALLEAGYYDIEGTVEIEPTEKQKKDGATTATYVITDENVIINNTYEEVDGEMRPTKDTGSPVDMTSSLYNNILAKFNEQSTPETLTETEEADIEGSQTTPQQKHTAKRVNKRYNPNITNPAKLERLMKTLKKNYPEVAFILEKHPDFLVDNISVAEAIRTLRTKDGKKVFYDGFRKGWSLDTILMELGIKKTIRDSIVNNVEVNRAAIPKATVDRNVKLKDSPVFAKTDGKTITINPAKSLDEFFAYIEGRYSTKTSLQKREVMKALNNLDYTRDRLKKLIPDEKTANHFLLLYHQSKIDDNVEEVYWDQGDDLLTQDKIDIEVRATVDALKQIEASNTVGNDPKLIGQIIAHLQETVKGQQVFNQESGNNQKINELFESNPELANEVYEAVGITQAPKEVVQDLSGNTYSVNESDITTYETESGPIRYITDENGDMVMLSDKNTDTVEDQIESDSQETVKEGVSELFESNPELANSVYGALGFKSKPDVILPIGTSGSGKSTFIKSLPQENLVIIEPDSMRVEFTGDMNNKSKDKEIYIEAAKRAVSAIKDGKQVVFDTTNLTVDKRLPFIEAIKKEIPTANIQYKLMELNPELAKQRIKAQLERGENRANVPDSTIDRHAESYKQMLEDIKNEPISNYEVTPEQKQQAQQIYSQYLEQNPNGNVEQFKSWVDEFNTNKYLQLASNLVNPAIEELDNFLLDFLKNFNVKSKQFEELKSRLGVNALGATDVLNKLIWYTKNRNEETLPEEAAHMLVALMGENHPDVKELLTNITNWSEYSSIKDQYLPIYKDEEKVKIEAVGKLISKSLVKNYKASGLNKNKLQKALDNIIEYIENILDGLNISDIFFYNENIADHIATNVLSGNKDYIYKITNQNSNLNAQKEIENNPNAKSVIKRFSSENVKITGSLAIAGTENIRRPEGQGIHDLDFKVKSFEVFDKEVLSKLPENAVPAHYGWHKKTYSTYAYLIPSQGYRIEVLERKDDFSNGWITDYKLYNEKNEQVKITQQNVMSVDFFVYKEGANQKDFDFSSEFIPASLVYEGKISLGGKTNPYFFSRDKDQEDYVLRNPKSFIPFEEHIYYQLDDTLSDFISQKSQERLNQVQEVFNENPELSPIGTPEQYSQYLDTIFPDSQVKDIVYHGSSSKIEIFDNKKFTDSFKGNPLLTKEEIDSIESSSEGYFFTSEKETALTYGSIIHKAILNVENLKTIEGEGNSWDSIVDVEASMEAGETFTNSTRGFFQQQRVNDKSSNKGIIFKDIIDQGSKGNSEDFNTSNVIAVHTSEQIHILGSKQDTEGFKNWVGNNREETITSSLADNSSIREKTQILLQEDRDGRILGQTQIITSNDAVNAIRILVDSEHMKDDTIPHEYAHVYIEMYEDHPLVQQGIKKWGSKEKLVQSVGEAMWNIDEREYSETRTWWKKLSNIIKGIFSNMDTTVKEDLSQILAHVALHNTDLRDLESLVDTYLKKDNIIAQEGSIPVTDNEVFNNLSQRFGITTRIYDTKKELENNTGRVDEEGNIIINDIELPDYQNVRNTLLQAGMNYQGYLPSNTNTKRLKQKLGSQGFGFERTRLGDLTVTYKGNRITWVSSAKFDDNVDDIIETLMDDGSLQYLDDEGKPCKKKGGSGKKKSYNKPKAEKGTRPNRFTKGSKWTMVQDLGSPKFKKGGIWKLYE